MGMDLKKTPRERPWNGQKWNCNVGFQRYEKLLPKPWCFPWIYRELAIIVNLCANTLCGFVLLHDEHKLLHRSIYVIIIKQSYKTLYTIYNYVGCDKCTWAMDKRNLQVMKSHISGDIGHSKILKRPDQLHFGCRQLGAFWDMLERAYLKITHNYYPAKWWKHCFFSPTSRHHNRTYAFAKTHCVRNAAMLKRWCREWNSPLEVLYMQQRRKSKKTNDQLFLWTAFKVTFPKRKCVLRKRGYMKQLSHTIVLYPYHDA